MDLNGFKEGISQQESEEENGCGLTAGFGEVMFLCDGWVLGSGQSLGKITPFINTRKMPKFTGKSLRAIISESVDFFP